MQHVPTAPTTGERPERDWIPIAAYVLMVLLLLIIVGTLVWPSLTVAPARDEAYVNPELRLAERYRAERAALALQPAGETVLYTKEAAMLAQANAPYLVDPYWTHFRGYLVAPDYATNPELMLLDSYRAAPVIFQDFEHTNPEVGLFHRLQEFER